MFVNLCWSDCFFCSYELSVHENKKTIINTIIHNDHCILWVKGSHHSDLFILHCSLTSRTRDFPTMLIKIVTWFFSGSLLRSLWKNYRTVMWFLRTHYSINLVLLYFCRLQSHVQADFLHSRLIWSVSDCETCTIEYCLWILDYHVEKTFYSMFMLRAILCCLKIICRIFVICQSSSLYCQ